MNIQKHLVIAASLAILFASNFAMADRVDRRQFRQQARIADGVRSGELTRPEARRLRAGERHVRRLERRADADGQVTGQEAARIENAQDRLSARIYRQKHDEQARGE